MKLLLQRKSLEEGVVCVCVCESDCTCCRLTQDVIFEQFPNEEFSALRTLDFPQCGLKIVDLSPVTAFDNLARYFICKYTNSKLLCYSV